MSAFTVEMNNEPGQLAQLCEAMAARQINLVVCGVTSGGVGTVAFIADDEAAARGVLRDMGMDAIERDVLTVRMDNVPGAGAATFRKLADAKLNVDLLLPVLVSTEEFMAVIGVADIEAARKVLGDQVASG